MRSSRSRRDVVVTCALAIALGAPLACSGTSPSDGVVPPPSTQADGGATVPPGCTRDAECNGGACKDVGAGRKACVRARSCAGGAGANNTCGGDPTDETALGASDCCETRFVPGGSYDRFNDTAFPAKVSPFLLDTYEVTVGRFRRWVEATNGDLRGAAPAEGAGAHPRIPGSGWRSEWNALLPDSRAAVDDALGASCEIGNNLDDYGALTWWTPALDARVRAKNGKDKSALAENTREALERKPLNCVSWYALFAFCVWDGGRLPTDAEWGYAAAAGDEQRAFPWGSPPRSELVHMTGRDDLSLVPLFAAGKKLTTAALFDPTLGANVYPDTYAYTWNRPLRTPFDNAAAIAPVGRKPLGNGKWGHADLAGGVHEWMLDEGPITPGRCDDCANVRFPKPDAFDPDAVEGIDEFEHRWYAGGARAIRGGAWDNSYSLAIGQTRTEIEIYTSYPVRRTYRALGGRCARDL